MIANVHIERISGNQSVAAEDRVAVEQPLEIQLSLKGANTRKSVSVTMRTPGHDEALSVGFLYTEGIIQQRNQVKEIQMASGNEVLVTLEEGVLPSLDKLDRNFYTTSSCGVCGKSSIEAIRTVRPENLSLSPVIKVSTSVLYQLQDTLRAQQEIFESTGGLHAAALFDLSGNLILVREDVGRHNALDKLIGTSFLTDTLPLSNSILLLSGRASFELIQKAGMAGIQLVAAIGAPSSLAIELAQEFNITLIGFLRERRLNVYCGMERIQLDTHERH